MSRRRPPRLASIGLALWCAILAEHGRAAADDPPAGYSLAWTAAGTYGGVGADRSGQTVFALGVRGKCTVLNPQDGAVVRDFNTTLEGVGRTIRVARLGDDKLGLVVFGTWSKGIVVGASDGAQLWTEGADDAVDDMAVADLDGDGRDEVIVGYNGDGGLHVFGPDGRRRWQTNDVANVWHVTAADLDGDGRPEVVCTSAGGDIHVYDARDGKPVATLKPSDYGSQVVAIPGAARPPARGDLLIADGSHQNSTTLMALGEGGKPLWSTPMLFRIETMAPSPDGKLLALALGNAEVTVVRVEDGRVVAQIPRPGFGFGFKLAPSVAWAIAPRPEGGEPLLLVANNSAVRAYRIQATPEAKP